MGSTTGIPLGLPYAGRECDELAGRGHAILKNQRFFKLHPYYKRIKFAIAGMIITALSLVITSTLFFLAKEGIIHELHEKYTTKTLLVIALLAGGGAALSLWGAWKTYKTYSPYYNRKVNFPYNEEHQVPSPNTPRGFSPGNWLGLRGSDDGPPLSQIKENQFGIYYKHSRGLEQRCWYIAINLGTHYSLSTGLELQEAILFSRMLKNAPYNCTIAPRKGADLMGNRTLIENAQLSEDDTVEALPGFEKVERVSRNADYNDHVLFENLVKSTQFRVSRPKEDLFPEFENDVGFTSITLNFNNSWYTRLIFKEEGRTLQESVEEVVRQLPENFTPSETPSAQFPGFTTAGSNYGACDFYSETHRIARRKGDVWE